MPGIHFREVVCMLGIFGLFLQAAAGHILYLALHLESGSFPRPLPPDRERAAFVDLQKGGAAAAQARDTLIRHNLRLVAHICKKYYAGNSAQDDMISIGTIGLIKAVDTFDPAKGKRFASYASRCIENELRMDLRRGRRTGVTLSLQEPLEADGQLTLADTLPAGKPVPLHDRLLEHAPRRRDAGEQLCRRPCRQNVRPAILFWHTYPLPFSG